MTFRTKMDKLIKMLFFLVWLNILRFFDNISYKRKINNMYLTLLGKFALETFRKLFKNKLDKFFSNGAFSHQNLIQTYVVITLKKML